MSLNYTVVFDACVLYPAPLRSLLMYLGVSGEFRARWSDDIHDEWIRNALKNNPGINKQSLESVRALIDSHVPGALVSGYHSDLYDLNAAVVIEAARSHRASLKNPPFDVDEYLDCLLRQRLTETVARLKRLRLTL